MQALLNLSLKERFYTVETSRALHKLGENRGGDVLLKTGPEMRVQSPSDVGGDIEASVIRME